jgi:serine O-acetyltransferase
MNLESTEQLQQIIHQLSQGEASAQDPEVRLSHLLTQESVREFTRDVRAILFPQSYRHRQNISPVEALGQILWRLTGLIHQVMAHPCREPEPCPTLERAAAISRQFGNALPFIQQIALTDARAAFEGDPAAQSLHEIITTYPGFHATLVYRLAHVLHEHNVPLLPRVMTEIAHGETGIDIHPGAQIGSDFFIDHGTGVVIGETTKIGNRVTLYQGVTLGALNFPHDQNGQIIRGMKRHPTIEDDVVIYSGATILGGNTVIGKNSVIGGNVWLTESVPPGSKVTAQSTIRLRSRQTEA